MPDQLMASISIVTYNQEHYIGETLDSMLAQDCNFAYEIVVGEDGSTDNTRQVIEDYQQRHPGRIRLMPLAPNKGLLRNFRDTLTSCTGKYLTICAGDDYWHDPKKLQKQVDFLESNPEYGIVHTDLDFYLAKQDRYIRNFNRKNQQDIVDGEVFEALLTSRFFINALTVCFRKELLDKHVDFAQFEAAGFNYEDLPTWLELSRHTLVKYMDESTATYRVLEDSVSRPTEVKKKFKFLQSHFVIKKYYIDRYNVDEKTRLAVEKNFHRKRFDMAYKWFAPEEGRESFAFLQRHDEVSMKLRAKNAVLSIPILYRAINSFKKLLIPATSVTNT